MAYGLICLVYQFQSQSLLLRLKVETRPCEGMLVDLLQEVLTLKGLMYINNSYAIIWWKVPSVTSCFTSWSC